MSDKLDAVGVYHLECYDKAGNLKWQETAQNLVTIQGKNSMLDNFFAGSGYTGTFYMSLISASNAVNNTATYASPTVTEIASGTISGNVRPTVAWSAAASGSKAATTTAFSITGAATITGNMLVSGGSGANAVGNTAAANGVLFSTAAFTGSKVVSSGDTLNVTYSISV